MADGVTVVKSGDDYAVTVTRGANSKTFTKTRAQFRSVREREQLRSERLAIQIREAADDEIDPSALVVELRKTDRLIAELRSAMTYME